MLTIFITLSWEITHLRFIRSITNFWFLGIGYLFSENLEHISNLGCRHDAIFGILGENIEDEIHQDKIVSFFKHQTHIFKENFFLIKVLHNRVSPTKYFYCRWCIEEAFNKPISEFHVNRSIRNHIYKLLLCFL